MPGSVAFYQEYQYHLEKKKSTSVVRIDKYGQSWRLNPRDSRQTKIICMGGHIVNIIEFMSWYDTIWQSVLRQKDRTILIVEYW